MNKSVVTFLRTDELIKWWIERTVKKLKAVFILETNNPYKLGETDPLKMFAQVRPNRIMCP